MKKKLTFGALVGKISDKNHFLSMKRSQDVLDIMYKMNLYTYLREILVILILKPGFAAENLGRVANVEPERSNLPF